MTQILPSPERYRELRKDYLSAEEFLVLLLRLDECLLEQVGVYRSQ